MRQRTSAWMCCVMLLLTGGIAAAAGDEAAPSFTTTGDWEISNLGGHDADKMSLWTMQRGATATWRPAFTGPVRARVYLHKIVYGKNDDTAVPVVVRHGEETDTIIVDFSEGQSGWESLGEYAFAGGHDEYVQLSRDSGAGTTRASAVRFDLLTDGGGVIQSFTLDELTDEAGRKLRPVRAEFADLSGHWAETAAESLATHGYASHLGRDRFGPDEPIVRGEFAAWLLRVTRNEAVAVDAAERLPSTEQMRAAAMHDAGGLMRGNDAAEAALGRDDMIEALHRAFVQTGKPMSWLTPDHDSADGDSAEILVRLGVLPTSREDSAWPGETVTRGHAAVALQRLLQRVIAPGPPQPTQWKLVFREEFEGDVLDTDVWRAEAGAPGHIQSSRWPENIRLENGIARLLTRKEERGGKQWTTGNIWTKTYTQQYGYFECRMRAGRATGLNNAFWMMTPKPGPDAPPDTLHFEIDVCEAKYPSRSNVALHQWQGEHSARGHAWHSPENIADDFHIYAAMWDENEIVWYVDGREVFRVSHDFARAPAPIRLSSAVAPFAGKITDALDGTSMDVDWVRTYSRVSDE